MKAVKNKLKKYFPILLLILSDIIFCIIYYILKVLKKVNAYELYYYFKSDTTGTGIDIILDGIKICLPLFMIILLILIIPITYSKKIKLKIKNINIYPNKIQNHKLLYSGIILIISILAILKTINFDKFYVNTLAKTDIYEKHYKNTNDVKLTFPENKRNLIILYLESMEMSLASKENGGAFKKTRIKELESLALENINFSNTDKLGGGFNLTSTSWTIASLVATTSGTPLMTTIRNRYKSVNEFMPKVKTLGDVLEKEGYNLEIIQGSNINFSGTKKYVKSHGNYKILDYNKAKKLKLIDEDYKEWWGFEDKKLFEYSKKEILKLAEEEAPFSVSIFTMDTHFKDGYLDSSCKEKFEDQLSNVYACSSKMVNDFINWLKEQDFYQNTTIVIIGDHITMQNSYYNDFPEYKRNIYNAFINSTEIPKKNKNRKFSSLDMYPTILASMGVKIEGEKLGFGVNLFSEEKTLIEELGLKKFDEELLKSSDYYSEHILDYNKLENLD
jgi:phosphoglycerol transferase